MRDTVDGNRCGDDLCGGSRIALVPYCKINIGWNISDDAMGLLYQELAEDGVIGQIFTTVQTEAQFLEYMKYPINFPTVPFDDEGPCGIAWLNNVESNSAFVHHGFVRRVWGQTIPIASKIIDSWFAFAKDGEHLIDVLIGSTPSNLRLARRFAKRLGFIPLSPDIPCVNGTGTMVSYLERTKWVAAKAEAAEAAVVPGRKLND